MTVRSEKQHVLEILNECFYNLVDEGEGVAGSSEAIYDEAREGVKHLIWVISDMQEYRDY